MSKDTVLNFEMETWEPLSLDEIARVGAQQMLRTALEAEVNAYLAHHGGRVDSQGRQAVVRNGYHRSRDVTVGCGSIEATVPRTRSRVAGIDEYRSSIVPPYMRRSLKIDEAIPLLYLKGISTGSMEEALQSLLGKDVSGISASQVSRLKECWQSEYEQWQTRDLSGTRYVYLYVDGIYTSVRLKDKGACLLVVIGVTEDGRKELVAVGSGKRESEDGWEELLRGLKAQGMNEASLAIGDGALGFWAALLKVYPGTERQRCTVHKKRNVLAKLPKSLHSEAARMYDDIINAEKKQDALAALEVFKKRFEITQPSAVRCLTDDIDALLQFYSYPKEHWRHIRSTNPIESTFSTVRLRTKSTRGMGTETTTFSMVFKLLQMAQKRWQRVFGYGLIPFVLKGTEYQDGEEVKKAA